MASGELGGRARMLADFAERAFESDVRLTVVVPRHGPLVETLARLGVACRVVPAPKRLLRAARRDAPRSWRARPRIFADLLRWGWALRREPAVRHADALYSVGPDAHIAATLARGRRPAVWHLHEYPPARRWRWVRRWLATAAIANSDDVRRAWETKTRGKGEGGREKKGKTGLTVIPSGVDLDRFHPAARTGWLHDRVGVDRGVRLIGMPAIYARWKGQLEVIAAFERIARNFPNVHLVILGGPIYETVAEEEYSRELLLRVSGEWPTARLGDPAFGLPATPVDDAPRVHLTGFIHEIEPAYPEFAFTVHYPLRPEPFGRPILESLACGVPVLAADEGGPREIVRHGQTGWLVPPRDVDAVAGAMAGALALPEERLAEMGAAARRDAEDRFSGREFARRVSRVLWETAG